MRVQQGTTKVSRRPSCSGRGASVLIAAAILAWAVTKLAAAGVVWLALAVHAGRPSPEPPSQASPATRSPSPPATTYRTDRVNLCAAMTLSPEIDRGFAVRDMTPAINAPGGNDRVPACTVVLMADPNPRGETEIVAVRVYAFAGSTDSDAAAEWQRRRETIPRWRPDARIVAVDGVGDDAFDTTQTKPSSADAIGYYAYGLHVRDDTSFDPAGRFRPPDAHTTALRLTEQILLALRR